MKIINLLTDYFSDRDEILSVYLFGSAALDKSGLPAGQAGKDSDVDIAVLFSDSIKAKDYAGKIISMTDGISRILDKEVDIVALNSADCILRFQVIKKGIRIVERDRIGNRRNEARSVIEYLDFIPMRRMMEESLIKRIKKGA
jgi:predicted nucleotidyltransferase